MGPDPGGPSGVPADIATRLVRALDISPSTVVALISDDLRNLWVSRSVAWVVGDDPDTAMKEKALTRVHPDDVHRLLQGLAQAKAAAPGDAPSLRVVEPLRFRVERPDGGWLALESLVINLLDDPVVNGLVAIVRPVGGEVEGVSRVVDLLVADAPLREVLAACAGLVPEYLGSAAVVGIRDGRPVVGAPAGTAAERLSVDDRWWRDTLVDGRPRTAMDHAGFPADLAVRACEAGFRSTWVLPLCDVAADEVFGCLVVWVRIAAEPNITNETGVRQAERLAGLVIGEQRRIDALRHEALTDPLTGWPTARRCKCASMRRPIRSRWRSSISTASSRSTTPTATRRATPCSRWSPNESSGRCARTTSWYGSAATSSLSCSRPARPPREWFDP